MIRIFLLVILFFHLSYGGYKNVKVGHIDRYYQDKITYGELQNIIDEVEQTLESQVGHELFGIDKSGVEISLVYLKPSIAQNSLDRKIKRYERKIKKLETLEYDILNYKKSFETMSATYEKESQDLNKKIKKYNNYVKSVNENRSYSHSQLQKAKQKITSEQSVLKKEQKKLKRLFSKIKSSQRSYNRKVSQYNNLIRSSKNLARDIERISRSMKIVKGNTFFNKEIEKKIYKQNNRVVKTDTKEIINNKIEIYSYESYGELRAVIAHEILHLVGVPHIEVEGALMNPYIQKNQIDNLQLTREDIENIKKHF